MWYIFYDRRYVHIHKRWRRDIFLIFVFFQTPLHYAAQNGYGDVVEILLRNGANVHEKNVRHDKNEMWMRREKLWETDDIPIFPWVRGVTDKVFMIILSIFGSPIPRLTLNHLFSEFLCFIHSHSLTLNSSYFIEYSSCLISEFKLFFCQSWMCLPFSY